MLLISVINIICCYSRQYMKEKNCGMAIVVTKTLRAFSSLPFFHSCVWLGKEGKVVDAATKYKKAGYWWCVELNHGYATNEIIQPKIWAHNLVKLDSNQPFSPRCGNQKWHNALSLKVCWNKVYLFLLLIFTSTTSWFQLVPRTFNM